MQPLHEATHHATSRTHHHHAGHDHTGHDHANHDHAGHEHSPNHDHERCDICDAIAAARHVTVDAGCDVAHVDEPLVELIEQVASRPAGHTARGGLGARAPPGA